MTLDKLKNGDKGIIIKVKGRGAFRKRILEMGFVKGEEINVIKNAPLKDPIEYKIMDYNVSLRRNEAKMIEVLSSVDMKKSRTINKQDRSSFIIKKKLKKIKVQKKIKKSLTNKNGIKKKLKKRAIEKGKIINVVLVGNPNSGKTTLFNYASGSKEHVGNYGGVTIKAKEAKFKQDGYTFNIVDLPGTYSVTAYTPEELFVRDFIINKTPDVIINVIDSSNLERNLYLTTQLIDLDVKVVAALNIFDELEKKGDKFDHEIMGKMIGIPFVPTVSSKGKGLNELFKKVINIYEDKEENVRHIHINYGNDIEESIKEIQKAIVNEENYSLTDMISSRFLAIKLLEKDKDAENKIFEKCKNNLDILITTKQEIDRLEEHLQEDTETLISDAKYGFISGALMETYEPAVRPARTISEKIDGIMTHRLLGLPIFMLFMLVTFQLTFTIGEYPMNWIESFMGLLSGFVSHSMADGILKELIVDGIIAGVGGVIIFLPNILILFFMISLMEDTGYMARASFIMDKLMHKMGLHGKSFIPLIMGFGCNAPAIMATRTLENKNDRMLTMLIMPFMSCSARLPVYVLFIGAFFPSYPGTVLFAIYITGILMAILSALVLRKTIFKTYELPFVMELPPYRMPRIKTSTTHMWEKGIHYLKKIGGVVLVASIIIWALAKFPLKTDYSKNYDKLLTGIEQKYKVKLNDKSLSESEITSINLKLKAESNKIKLSRESERLQKSYIGSIGKFIEPVIAPIGFDWKMGVSIVTGFAAKEIVVSTMGVLYNSGFDANEESDSLKKNLQAQTYTSGPKKGEKVFTPLAALAFMIFVLLYVPCIAAMATLRRESGSWKWALFSALHTTTLAWLISFLVYRVGNLII